MKNRLLNIVFFCFFSASASYAQTPQALMDSIITRDIFESERVSVGVASIQYSRFKKLTEILSKEQMEALTAHENGVLRMYTATYLVEEQGADPVPLFLKELERNELIETFEGCIMSDEYTSNLVYFL